MVKKAMGGAAPRRSARLARKAGDAAPAPSTPPLPPPTPSRSSVTRAVPRQPPPTSSSFSPRRSIQKSSARSSSGIKLPKQVHWALAWGASEEKGKDTAALDDTEVQNVELKILNEMLEKLVIATQEKHEAQMLFEKMKAKRILEEFRMRQPRRMSKEDEELQLQNISKQRMADLDSQIQEATRRLESAKEERKYLHNKLLDLKGIVRVFVRIRPLKAEIKKPPFSVENEDRVIKVESTGRKITFDKIFKATATQEDIFNEVAPLIQSALDGKKVCVFAYGQTGSGKTFTVMGNTDVKNEYCGLFGRTIQFILKKIENLPQKMKVSGVEIYNEQLKDLLYDGSGGHDLAIHYDEKNLPFVQGLSNTIVTDVTQLDLLAEKIESKRSVGATEMNKCSSRSHCIFKFTICDEDEQDIGGIAMIDLAGCEVIEKTKVTGIRKEEAKYISKTLSLLRRVLTAISIKHKGHIPFRDSKLTKVLQPFLQEDTKVLMIATLSQETAEVAESASTLRFAEDVRYGNGNEMFSPVSRCRTVQRF